MEAVKVKEEARRLVERLPEDATWDDVMHEIYVRQSIEAGLADAEAGRLTSVENVRSKFGLSKQ
jgi:predicted transcriptional regulator